jgi:RNA polymerase sigma-70 factor (ECF subfamily)
VERIVTELYRAHVGFVERVLRRAGVEQRDVADARQDVFAVVHRRLADFEGRSSPQTWLYRIAWNVASEYRRRPARRHELLEGEHDVADRVATPAEAVEGQRSLAALHAAIERLDADKREALICHELDEQPMSAVATRLGIPLKTAFSRLYAARRALQLELRKQGWAGLAWWSRPFERIETRLRPAGRLNPSWFELLLGAAALLGLMPAQPLTVRGSTPAVQQLQPAFAVVTPSELRVAASPPQTSVLQDTRTPARRSRARVNRLPAAPPPSAARALEPELTVVRTGRLDLERGPFGESPLAHPPLVEPHRHPRVKLVLPSGTHDACCRRVEDM